MFKAQRLIPSSRFLPTSPFASKLMMTDRMTGSDVRLIGEKSANQNNAHQKYFIFITHRIIILYTEIIIIIIFYI